VLIFVAQIAGLIEKAEIRPFHIEADGSDAAFVRREMREDRPEQEFDRARFRREP